jgi:hypothetical protein
VMRYKSKVLATYPNATLAAVTLWEDGSPKHWSVVSDAKYPNATNDIHSPEDVQGKAAAWRSAYYWQVRQRSRPVTKEEAA